MTLSETNYLAWNHRTEIGFGRKWVCREGGTVPIFSLCWSVKLKSRLRAKSDTPLLGPQIIRIMSHSVVFLNL
jgi:hypothetical protein